MISSRSGRSGEVGEAQHAVGEVAGERGAGAAQHDADARDQFLQAERLGDVVVTADRQAGQLVLHLVAGGEEEDRNLPRGSAQLLGDREAVQVGQHYVQHRQVG